jgi:hypothetical protein
LGAATAAIEELIEKTPLDSQYDNDELFAGANYYHSMALLTALLWAKAENKTDWIPAGQVLWTAYFDEAVAKAVPGTSARVGAQGVGAVLNRALAYSALDPLSDSASDAEARAAASKPFGDTAIWSMFNDAGDLGKVLAKRVPGGADTLNAFFDEVAAKRTVEGLVFNSTKDVEVKQLLADMLVQYAGALALNDIEAGVDAQGKRKTITTAKGDHVDVTQGVLASGNGGAVLALDLSSVLWEDVFATTGGTKVDPINAAEFRKVYFEQGAQAALDAIIGWFGFQDIDAMARAMWGGKDASVIDRFHMVAGTQDGGTFTLAERSYVTSPARGANDNDRAPERIAA